jgi:hypothetical protein
MIRHVVTLRWQQGTTDEQKQQVAADLATLPPLMTGLVSFHCGDDQGLVQGNADFAITADFDDAAAYLAYRNHPAHLAVMERSINPIVAQRIGVQFQI